MHDIQQLPVRLEARGVKTWFAIRRGLLSHIAGYVRAVDGVSFDVRQAETLALVGESGCGKSTVGRTILGLEPARDGTIMFDGNDLLRLTSAEWKPYRRRLQMIFQDPQSALNPRMTALDILAEGPAHHGLLSGRREELAARLLNEVGMDATSMHRYPHEFSGGQRQRICIARALSLNPEFVVCDEAVSALDVSVQSQIVNLLVDLRDKYRLSYLFIAHDLSVVRLIAHRVAVMYLGHIVEMGDTRAVLSTPRHPYTQALMSAAPVPGRDRAQRVILSGEVPSPANPPIGCPFHPRCPNTMDICRREFPETRTVDGRSVNCHLYTPQPSTERAPR